jgi:hypothetical protein
MPPHQSPVLCLIPCPTSYPHEHRRPVAYSGRCTCHLLSRSLTTCHRAALLPMPKWPITRQSTMPPLSGPLAMQTSRLRAPSTLQLISEEWLALPAPMAPLPLAGSISRASWTWSSTLPTSITLVDRVPTTCLGAQIRQGSAPPHHCARPPKLTPHWENIVMPSTHPLHSRCCPSTTMMTKMPFRKAKISWWWLMQPCQARKW